MSKRKMSVYGGTYDGTHRLIVAAKTKKDAHAAMLSVVKNIGSYGTWVKWTSETGNDEECELALSAPMCVFKRKDIWGHGGQFEKME